MSSSQQLDRTFSALSDPTRRAILARLGHSLPAPSNGMPVKKLAEPFRMSLPAILKHLKVLEDAGLVRREKIGRTVHCRLDTGPMREAIEWLERTEGFWCNRLDALAAAVEKPSHRKAGKE